MLVWRWNVIVDEIMLSVIVLQRDYVYPLIRSISHHIFLQFFRLFSRCRRKWNNQFQQHRMNIFSAESSYVRAIFSRNSAKVLQLCKSCIIVRCAPSLVVNSRVVFLNRRVVEDFKRVVELFSQKYKIMFKWSSYRIFCKKKLIST